MDVRETLIKKLNIKNEELGCSTGSKWFGNGEFINSFSPVDGKSIGKIKTGSKKDYETIINSAQDAFIKFRKIPAPKRGELVRQFGEKLRKNKEELGTLVS